MYTWMKSTRNINRSVQYPITDKEEQSAERVEGMLFGGGLIDTGSKEGIVKQYRYVLDRAGRRFRKGIDGEYPIQGIIRTVSFSEKEIAKDDADGADKALKVVQDTMNNIAPDCLYMAVAQRDGKAGYWHVHIVQNAVHTSTLKAMSGRETNYDIFRKQAERFAVENGIELDAGEKHPKRRSKSESKKRREHAKQTEGFSWMDDLQHRIVQAATMTLRAADYEENLRQQGVTVSRKTKTGWTYELAECEQEEFVGKKARYDKFDGDFSNKLLRKLFDDNYRKAQKEKAAAQVRDKDGKRILPDVSGIQREDGYGLWKE